MTGQFHSQPMKPTVTDSQQQVNVFLVLTEDEQRCGEAAARAILQGRLRAASEPALLTGARPGTADMGEADMALLNQTDSD